MALHEISVCDHIRWVDLSGPTPEQMQDLAREFNLNTYIVRDCLQPEHLPKYEFVDGVHFLILRYYTRGGDKSTATIQDLSNKLAIFYTKDFLITIHVTEVPFVELVRKKHVARSECASVTDVLSRLCWQALETYDDPVARLSEQIDFHEAQIITRRLDVDHMQALYLIKREAAIAHKILLLMAEPLAHIHLQPGDEAALQDVKDQHLKMQTLYSQVLDEVANLMNLYLSFSAQRTNEVMKVLTIFSVFFMPITFIVGVYGMNFQYMPELAQRWGYPAVWVLMLGVTASIYLWIKQKGWLK